MSDRLKIVLGSKLLLGVISGTANLPPLLILLRPRRDEQAELKETKGIPVLRGKEKKNIKTPAPFPKTTKGVKNLG